MKFLKTYVDRSGMHPCLWGSAKEDTVNRIGSYFVFRERADQTNARMPGPLLKLVIAVTWALLLTKEAIRTPVFTGRAEGRTRLQRVRDFHVLFSLGIRRNVDPLYFYLYRLYKDTQQERFLRGGFVTSRQFASICHAIMRSRGHFRLNLHNKDAFNDFCEECGLPHAPSIKCAVNALHEHNAAVFLKPSLGSYGGERCYKAVYSERIQKWEVAGRILSVRQFCDWVAEVFDETVLVQPLLVNHDLIRAFTKSGALCTIRIMTCCEEAEPVFVRASMRLGLEDANVDNFTHGGACVAIEGETGRLGEVFLQKPYRLRPKLPDGTRVYGMQLPFWNEAKELCLKAHRAAPVYWLLSWDVALCQEGPVLVECNTVGQIDILQLPHNRPLLDQNLMPAFIRELEKLEGRHNAAWN